MENNEEKNEVVSEQSSSNIPFNSNMYNGQSYNSYSNTNQNSKIDQNQIQLLSSLGEVSSNVNFKLEQIIMQLISIGASNPVLPAYESADLEVY